MGIFKICFVLLALFAMQMLLAGGESSKSTRYVTIACKNNETVTLPYASVCLSEELKKQLVALGDEQTYTVTVNDCSKDLIKKMASLLAYIKLQGNEPLIVDLKEAYAQPQQSVSLKSIRILDKLSVDELVKLITVMGDLGFISTVLEFCLEFLAQKVTHDSCLRAYIANKELLKKLLCDIPPELKALFKQKLITKRGYLLWGCLHPFMRIISINHEYFPELDNKLIFWRDYLRNDSRELTNTRRLSKFFTLYSYCYSFDDGLAIIILDPIPELYWRICDRATCKIIFSYKLTQNILNQHQDNQKNWGFQQDLQVSPDHLTLYYTDDDSLSYQFSISDCVSNLSCEQCFMLILLEYARITGKFFLFKNEYFNSIYTQYNAEIQAKLIERYGPIAQLCGIL